MPEAEEDRVVSLKSLVELVARTLADEPEQVQVTERERRGGLHFELHVAPGDLGRVIGRQGRTASALRLLLAAAADVDGQRIQLDIRDSTGRR